MAQINHKKDYSPQNKGLNTRFVPPTLDDLELAVAKNCQVNNNGTLEKYPGYTKDGSPFPNTADSFIRTIFEFRRGITIDSLLIAASDAGNTNATYKVDIKSTIGDGTYQYIVHNIGTATITNGSASVTGQNTSWTKELKPGDKIKTTADSDSFYKEISLVNSDTSLTLVSTYGGTGGTTAAYSARKVWSNNNVPRMCVFNNLAIITDGEGVPQAYNGTSLNGLINSYSGTTITVAANPAPKGTQVIAHKNRLFMIKNSTLYWSFVNDQTNWDPTSFEDVFPQDGGDLIAEISFGDSIFLFKNNGKVYRVFGNFDDSDVGEIAYLTKVDYADTIGIIADRSVFIHNDMLYFLAETGVYSIDQRGLIKRISYYIEPTTNTYNFSVGGQTSKTFAFQTKTQWDSGTHSGTVALQSGIIESFFDDFRQTDAKQDYNLCSAAIGTDNVVHVAYVTSANAKKVNYVKYATDGTVTKEDVGISLHTVSSLSIDVSSADQTVGICYSTTERAARFVERTPGTLGTWGATTNIGGVSASDGVFNVSFKYTSGGVPQVGWIGSDGASIFLGSSFRTGSVWSSQQLNSFGGFSDSKILRVCLVLDSSNNIYIAYIWGAPDIFTTKSTNGGTTFSTIEDFRSASPNISLESNLCAFVDHSNNFFTTWSNTSGVIKKRNHTAGTETAFDSTSGSLLRGFLDIYNGTSDVLYCLNITGSSPAQAEKYFFETSSTLTNPTVNVISKTASARPGDKPLVNNGQTIASIGFGTNANEIVIRRICFFGSWTGPEQHDSTLSAWGTYVVSGQVDGGNTLQQKIALASSSPATSFNNINSGSVISSNSALIYNVPKFTFSLLAWAGVQITSIVLNYTGAGIDARQAFGISFYNEAYFAVSEMGQTINNVVLLSDIKNAYIILSYAVNCMERFKTHLYAGSSTNGDLYVLKQGFAYNTSAYDMDVQTKEDFLDSPELLKDMYKIYVFYKVQNAGTFVFSYRFDQFTSSSSVTWNDTTIDQTQNGFFDIPLNGQKVRSIQYRIRNQNAGEQVQLLGFTTHYGLLDRR